MKNTTKHTTESHENLHTRQAGEYCAVEGFDIIGNGVRWKYDVELLIEEERYYFDDTGIIQVIYVGRAFAKDIEITFEISEEDWWNNRKFRAYFSSLLGVKFSPLRQDFKRIRQVARSLSEKKGIERVTVFARQGYYKNENIYLMPSVTVDCTGIRPNKTIIVDLAMSKISKSLDFTNLDDGDLKDVLLHIKEDFLRAWPELWSYVGLSHTLSPLIYKPLGIMNKSTLVYEGPTDNGQTDLALVLQNFWGNFQTILNLNTSSAGILGFSHEFKNACLVLGGCRNLDNSQKKAVINTIQNSYNGFFRAKAGRVGTHQKLQPYDAHLIISGDHFIRNDGSTKAQTILIETEKQDLIGTREKHAKVQEMMPHYRGITPAFGAWFLRQECTAILQAYHERKVRIACLFKSPKNIPQIAQSLAGNLTVFCLFLEFMVERGVLSKREKEEMERTHEINVNHLAGQMVQHCSGDKNLREFSCFLTELINSRGVGIDGWAEPSGERKETIGYLSPDEKKLFLIPSLTFRAVLEKFKVHDHRWTERSVADQLKEKGILHFDVGRNRMQIRRRGERLYFWVLDFEKLRVHGNEWSSPNGKQTQSRTKTGPSSSKVRMAFDDLEIF